MDSEMNRQVVQMDRRMDRLMEERSDGCKDLHTNTLMLPLIGMSVVLNKYMNSSHFTCSFSSLVITENPDMYGGHQVW